MTDPRPFPRQDVIETVRAAVKLELETIRKLMEAAEDRANRTANTQYANAYRAVIAIIKARESEIR